MRTTHTFGQAHTLQQGNASQASASPSQPGPAGHAEVRAVDLQVLTDAAGDGMQRAMWGSCGEKRPRPLQRGKPRQIGRHSRIGRGIAEPRSTPQSRNTAGVPSGARRKCLDRLEHRSQPGDGLLVGVCRGNWPAMRFAAWLDLAVCAACAMASTGTRDVRNEPPERNRRSRAPLRGRRPVHEWRSKDHNSFRWTLPSLEASLPDGRSGTLPARQRVRHLRNESRGVVSMP